MRRDLEIFHKTKNTSTYDHQFHYQYFSKKGKMYTRLCIASFIHKSPKLNIAQVFTDRQKNKQIIVFSYNGLLLSSKKKEMNYWYNKWMNLKNNMLIERKDKTNLWSRNIRTLVASEAVVTKTNQQWKKDNFLEWW